MQNAQQQKDQGADAGENGGCEQEGKTSWGMAGLYHRMGQGFTPGAEPREACVSILGLGLLSPDFGVDESWGLHQILLYPIIYGNMR